jgi:hypothetical protein
MDLQRRRRIARRILLAGVVAGAITYAWGVVEDGRAQQAIEALELKCKAEADESKQRDQASTKELSEWLQEHPAKPGQWPPLPPDWHYDNENSSTPVPNKVTVEEVKTALRQILLARGCSAERLSTESYKQEVMLTAMQEKLRDTYRNRIWAWYSRAALWAGFVVAVSAIPWLWYFVLDRLRELSAAIQGKKE